MKIAIFSIYSPRKAAHGGQHRLKNMLKFLNMNGHTAQSFGILNSKEYASDENYLDFPGEDFLRKFTSTPLMYDWAVGQLVATDQYFGNELKSRIHFKPDLVLVEQPWLFDFALKYVNEFGRNKPKLVYGSQNIESILKKDIVEKYLGENESIELSELVLKCEINAIRNSKSVLCVSQHDLDWCNQFKETDLYLVSNGVSDNRATYDDVKAANAISGGKRFALYCASGHPPNIEGFFDIFKDGIGSFSPDQKLIVAGGAGPIIANHRNADKISGLKSSLLAAGTISDSQLRGLLATAHVIILPITSGGGTNLKTAEALWSGQRIVATNKAFRGFEKFCQSSLVELVDKPHDFVQALSICMRSPPCSIKASERAERRSVLWGETLKPLLKAVE